MNARPPKLYPNLAEWRAARSRDFMGQSIGFVPTMGALHAGHRALLERASAENDRVVLSIFVNPTQFNDPTDLAKYPRTLQEDLAVARGLVTDVIMPQDTEVYPHGYRLRVSENQFSRELEGAHRPGHFDGVLTVVLKLIQLVQPYRAYFGEKDRQQLQLVQLMAQDLFLPTEIVSCPTVRADDGLALSSRNQRLTADSRARAAHFPRILREASDAASATRELGFAGFDVDYVEDRDGVRLGAVRLDGIRLIDNVRL